MNIEKKKKYIFNSSIFILVAILMYNIITLDSSLENKERIEDWFYSIDNIEAFKLNDEKTIYDFSKEQFLILLSNSGCNPCQIENLIYMQKIKDSIKIETTGLYLSENKKEILKLRRASKINFPINFFKINIDLKNKIPNFPIVLYISNNKILNIYNPNQVKNAKFYDEIIKNSKLKFNTLLN